MERMLADAGWAVQDAGKANLRASLGVAVREFVLAAPHGRADYLLFVDGAAAGVVEAKKEGQTLTGVEWQSAKYVDGLGRYIMPECQDMLLYSQDMRTSSPQLLPIFRSEGQGRLLARVYLAADRPPTVAQLARELGLDDGGLTREANRLERAGVIRSERVGRSRVLRPNEESPYYPELYGLLLKAFGPATVIGPELAEIDGIESAYVYGSWAARYLGEPGDDPADIDVLVVGRPSQLAVARAERTLSDRLGREVSVIVVPAQDWEAGDSGFLQHVREGPLVPLPIAERD